MAILQELDPERAAFEAWAGGYYTKTPRMFLRGFKGEYVINRIEEVFAAWQARGQQQAGVPEDAARLDYIDGKHVMGASYGGITSINVLVHQDDYAMGGVRYAIDCQREREAGRVPSVPGEA